MTTTARRVAFDALRRIEADGAYANIVLGAMLDRSDLHDQDRRFATDLVYGTTRMRRACDALVDRFVTSPPDDATRTLLRLGAYQLVFGDVAPHAAVSETVGLAPRRTRGFVNAVLRKVSSDTTKMVWPSEAARLSYPDWIVDRLTDELGRDDALASLVRMNEPATVTVRDDGYVQDTSSQWVAAAVEVQPGERILDTCSAPGGKATAMAAAGAAVTAADVRANRVSLVAANAERLGLDIDCVVEDATAPSFDPATFDAVLIDAPCSGLGALRRRPDARWRIRPSDVDDLVGLQLRIIAASAPLVRPGGRLVYSVCTLTAAESVDHPVPDGFEIDDRPPEIGAWRPFEHGWRVLPHDADTDGMVLVRYRRTA
ncbi:MAG: methyltransferase domain-containing protein [Ilumatobacter sp.]|nr:methyltransferase domain-containing protein [Ilumatobacter sp.]